MKATTIMLLATMVWLVPGMAQGTERAGSDVLLLATAPDDRQDRRQERGRSDERQDRRDCRQEEGRTGDDKRECKQEEVRDGVRGGRGDDDPDDN
jgi:hypothetical protein